MNFLKILLAMIFIVATISVIGYLIVAAFMLCHYVTAGGVILFFSVIMTVIFIRWEEEEE